MMTRGVFTLCWLYLFCIVAVCSTGTVLPTLPQGCFDLFHSYFIPVGEKVNVRPCTVCYCETPYEPAICYYMDCMSPMCVDYVESSNGCYNCPNGINCNTPWGETISGDAYVVNESSGLECRCEPDYFFRCESEPQPFEATCRPLPQPSTTPQTPRIPTMH